MTLKEQITEHIDGMTEAQVIEVFESQGYMTIEPLRNRLIDLVIAGRIPLSAIY